MNYHNITKDDMLNGDGLRVVLWLSGCEHNCKSCHNPQTHDPMSGIPFDKSAEEELFEHLSKDYIDGITFSGGDPLHPNNVKEVLRLIEKINKVFNYKKTIWLYTGYTFDGITSMKDIDEVTLHRQLILSMCDVIVDGKFVEELSSTQYHWAGSTNQNVLDFS